MINKNTKNMNESMFSQIDLIRQDSKDVRDFVKKVFSDREFKSMSKDTDFIKYLKSIYEGTHLDEEHVKFSNRTQNGTITTGSVQTTNETINEVNNRLNKKVKSELDAYLKGTKINSPEHQHAIMMILKGALTDANFHSEAKQLPKFFPKAKQSKYVGTAMEGVIEDKGAAYSKAAKWDGHDIIDAFSFYTSMTIGGSFGKKLETLKESISESINESLKHNDMYTMLDIAAGYSSTQDQAAGQMWSDEQDLYDYLKSDHIPKKYHKKFHNDIKRRFKDIKESVVTEGRSINAISKLQQKNIDDIAKALDFYKKNKDTDKKEAFIKVLKKLGDEKKKLAKELDDKVSGMYKDAEYKGESVVTEAGDTKATLTKRRANLVKSNDRFGNLQSTPNRRNKISVNNAEIKSIDSKLKSLNKNESVVNEGKFKKDDLVYNKRTKTVGIVRLGDDKSGEVKTDADGNVDVDELEKYNPIKNKHQNNAKVAPSTEKEVSKRGLFNPFKNESVVTEAKEDDVITQLRKIVKDKQNALVVDTKSKKKVRVDMQSASLMVQVYDAIKQQSSKDKFVNSGIVQMGKFSWKILNK